MTKGFLSDSDSSIDYGISPPIMPNDQIMYAGDFCGVFPVMDQENPSQIDHWSCGVEKKNERGKQEYDQSIIADASETWCSPLTKVSDPETGLETGCLLGKQHTYIISKDTSGLPSFQKIPRTDPSSQNNAMNGVFFSSVLMDNADFTAHAGVHGILDADLVSKNRLMYGLFSGADSSLSLHDVRDPSVHLNITLQNHKILAVHHVTVMPIRKTCYLCFVMSLQDMSDNQHVTGIYFIKNTDFVQALKKAEPLVDDNFLTYHSAKGYFVRDFTTSPFYFDTDNAGSKQIALCLQDKTSLYTQILSMDARGQIKLVCENKQDCLPQILPLDVRNCFSPGIMRLVKTPKGEPLIILQHTGITVEKIKDQRFRNVMSFVRLSTMRYFFLAFNEVEKKLSVMLSKDITYRSDYFPNIDAALTKEEEHHDIVGRDIHYDIFPAIVHSCIVPQIDFEEKDKSIQVTLTGLRVFYRIVFSYQKEITDTPSIIISRRVLFYSDLLPIIVNKSGSYEFSPSVNNEVCIANINFCVHERDIFNTHTNSTSQTFTYADRFTQGWFCSDLIDFTGKSIVVGAPKLTFNNTSLQMIGLYQCLPFDTGIQQTLPTLMISTSQGVVKGISKSTTSTWHASLNTSVGFSGAFGSVSAHYGKNWGGTTMNMSTDQKSTSLHVTTGNANSDILHTYTSNFYLWEYPIFCKSKVDDALGYLSILIPDGFVDVSLDVTDPRITHNQDYEIGKILTYLNSQKPGYELKNLWFQLEEVTCTSDVQGGGSSIVYSKQNSTHQDVQKTVEDGFNAGGTVSLSLDGFTGSVSGSYTKTNVKNSATSTMRTEDLSISVHTGALKEEGYEYLVKPLIYSHAENNMLMICHEVSLVGPLWEKAYQKPDVILMRVYPFAEDTELKNFTRSIRFIENDDDSVDIDVHLFSNSFASACDIVCKIYEGKAIYTPNTDPDIRNCTLIGTLKLPTLDGLAREILTLKKQKIKDGTTITVEIFHDDLEIINKCYYWGVYPYDALKMRLESSNIS